MRKKIITLFAIIITDLLVISLFQAIDSLVQISKPILGIDYSPPTPAPQNVNNC